MNRSTKTVLLADDEPNIRELVRITLDDPSYRIVEAENGHQTLDLLRSDPPDLLIVDWMMPGISGIEIAELLQQVADGPTPNEGPIAAPPIIMLTAKGGVQDLARGRRAGVVNYLVKPFSPLELMDRVQQLLCQ